MTEALKVFYRQYGGKSSIAKWVISHFPQHRIYCEPFCGGAAVLLAKPRSFIEIVNDLDSTIIDLFLILRNDPDVLSAALWATPYSPSVLEFQSETAIDAAVMAMAESQQLYSGNRNTSTWAIDKCPAAHKPKPAVWADWFKRIRPAAERLRGVQVLCEDGIKTIKRVSGIADCLIYVDPPYLGHEKEYRFGVDYAALVAALTSSSAKIVVSEYPEAIPFFPGWRVIEREMPGRCRTGAHNMKAKTKRECLIMNFEASA